MMPPRTSASDPWSGDVPIAELATGALDAVLAGMCASDGEPCGQSATHGGTDILMVSHGACGVAHVLTQGGRDCPPRLLEWMRARAPAASRYPPGLMTGLAGMAWTFWELGFTDEARRLVSMAFDRARCLDTPDLYSGRSGIGMAALWMYARTDERQYVDWAREIGERLSSTASEREHGVCWPDADGRVRFGYSHGASGVAAFLLYLYLSTGEWRWLKLGRQALAFDVSQAGPEGCACWKHGAAGVAGVLTRYYAVLGHPMYEALLCTLAARSTRHLERLDFGYFHGLAGVGQMLLDLAILCRSVRAEEWATRVAIQIASRAVRSPRGYSFEAHGRRIVTGGIASGAAGVALFFTRLRRRQTSSFMLDELFDRDGLQELVSWSAS